MADDNFTNNPFRFLDAGKFPAKKRGRNADAPKRPTKTSSPPQPDADGELFLRAMSRVRKPETTSGAFSLAETLPDAFQSGGKKQKRQNHKARAETAMPKQAAVPAPQPSQDDEAEAFLWAMRDATPLGGGGRKIIPPLAPAPEITPRSEAFEDLLAAGPEFSISFSDEYLEGRVVGLDEQIMNRLRQGSMSPEAHLDLHGLNAVQAFESLRAFMRGAWFKSMRVVLLVPGRGRNSPDGQGVLRQKLQSWLTQEPFKRVVLAFCTAQPHDGGPGSIYVLLRKFRKKGPVYWERLPGDADLY